MKVTFTVDNLKNMNSELKAFDEFLRVNDIADDDIFASKLISCELITNVIRHGGEAAEFKGELLPDRICITVTADSLKAVDLKKGMPDVFAESGRGLYIIRCVCSGDIERDDGSLRVYVDRHNDKTKSF